MPTLYDEDEKPVTKPDLNQLEGIHKNKSSSGPLNPTKANNSKGSKSLSPTGLNNAELGSGKSASSGVGGNISAFGGGGFYTSGDSKITATGGFAKIRQLATQATTGHRKAAIGGIGGILGLLLVVLGFGGIVSYELVNIEKTLIKYETKVEAYVEKKTSQNLLQNIICWQKSGGCKSSEDSTDDADKPTAAEEAAAEANDETLTEDMDSFDLTSPAVEADFAKAGLTVEASGGKLTGIDDSSGADVSEVVGSNDNVMAQVDTGLDDYDVGQEISFRPTMSAEFDSSWDILSDTPTDNAQEDIENVDTHGADNSQIDGIIDAEDENTAPNQNAGTNANTQYSDGEAQSTELNNAINAEETTLQSDLAAGDSTVQADEDAEAAGVAEFNLGSSLLVSTVASDVCDVKEAADAASNKRVPEIISLLIRHFTTLISLADQLKSSRVTTNEVDSTMSLYNGDPTAPAGSEASKPFTSSAAWQRATGGQVDSDQNDADYTPDIKASAIPSAIAGTKIVSLVDSISSKIGGNLVCAVENSKFGGIANFFGGIVQLVSDDFSFGLTQVAAVASIVGIQQLLQHEVIPAILEYFTPIGLNGGEDSVQQLNNSDAGANLATNNYSRSMGGVSETDATATTQYNAANNQVLAEDAQLPLTDRLFSIDDPYSLVSHFFDELPLGFTSTMASLSSYFTDLPSILSHSIASVFSPYRAFAAAATDPGEPYGVTQYSFSNSDITKYNPVANEAYLFGTTPYSPITYNGKTASRIEMLGNPNSYVPSTGGDPNNNDLLHCFVDPPLLLADASDGSTQDAKRFCGGQPSPTVADLEDGSIPSGNISGGLGTYDDSINPDTGQPYDDPNDIPGNAQVIEIYCQYFVDNPTDTACDNAMASQVNDDVGHFRQYLLDLHVMEDYTSLTNDD